VIPGHQPSDLELSFEASRRTFGAPPPSIIVHNGSAQLSYFIYSCTVRTQAHHTTQQPQPSCPRELASKRALHPINNVKQPKNKIEDQRPSIVALDFFSFYRGRPAGAGNKTGGAERDRTDDLLLAKQALSQLSYSPIRLHPDGAKSTSARARARKVGGPGKI
jgi:hypothetical protein